MNTRVYIVRHGQTEMNLAKRLQGRTDTPLNETGRAQAKETYEKLKEAGIVFDRVFSSPLCRAAETARLVSGREEILTDERLLEMDYGPWEGTDLSRPCEELRSFFSDFVNHPAPAGMEPLAHVVSRLGLFLEEIKDRYPGENILISTHAVAMKGALEYLDPDAHGGWWSRYIGNCAIYASEAEDGKYTVPKEVRLRDIKEEPGV